MQWDASANGGFTTGRKPWLAVNPNYKKINAKDAVGNPDSIYHYFRRMIALRKEATGLVYGDYKDLDPQNKKIFAYTRTLGPEKYLIVLNFSGDAVSYAIPGGLKAGHLQISNLGQTEENTTTLHLKGWEARVYRM